MVWTVVPSTLSTPLIGLLELRKLTKLADAVIVGTLATSSHFALPLATWCASATPGATPTMAVASTAVTIPFLLGIPSLSDPISPPSCEMRSQSVGFNVREGGHRTPTTRPQSMKAARADNLTEWPGTGLKVERARLRTPAGRIAQVERVGPPGPAQRQVPAAGG